MVVFDFSLVLFGDMLYYNKVYERDVVDMIDNNTQFFKTQPEKTISVEGILEQVYLALKEKGYNVKTNDVEVISKTTIINNTDVDGKYIEQIQELLGVGVLSSSTTASNNTDVTIIIGKDYK